MTFPQHVQAKPLYWSAQQLLSPFPPSLWLNVPLSQCPPLNNEITCTFFISMCKWDLVVILKDNLLPSPNRLLVDKSAIAGQVFQ